VNIAEYEGECYLGSFSLFNGALDSWQINDSLSIPVRGKISPMRLIP
jgi:hypothetical protein